MEKLMGYVKEMQEEGINVCRPQFQQYDLLEMCLISKHYGLIKWLIEKDKVDIEKIEDSDYYLIDWRYYYERKSFGLEWKEDVEKILLMLLAVNENPIEFLLSVLK